MTIKKFRPDIHFSLSFLARYVSAPTDYTKKMLDHLFRYLSGTRSLKLSLSVPSCVDIFVLDLYVDASFADDPISRNSTTGILLLLNNNPLVWISTKQKSVSTCSLEAELHALEKGGKIIIIFIQTCWIV